MEFMLDDEQNQIFETARLFGEKHIAPFAADWEAEGCIPKEIWPKLAELGLGGICVGERFGGSGMSRTEGTLVFEALSISCPSVAAFLSIHNMCAQMIESFGSEDLKSRYLRRAVRMELVLSYCLTEPGSGSDASALKSKAVRLGSQWRLSGAKAFISGGGYSDAYIAMCRTGGFGANGISAFVVDSDSPGLSFGGLEAKMGWKSQPTRQVQFDECVVSDKNMLGQEGSGFKYAMAALDGGRLNIAACSLGGAQAAFERTVSYMKERRAFGKPIAEFQALRFKASDIATSLAASRVFLREAAARLDSNSAEARMYCAMAKRFVTDECFAAANACLQLHGGYGYLCDYGIEKMVRDLRVHQILEGTNEIMRVIIARQIFGD